MGYVTRSFSLVAEFVRLFSSIRYRGVELGALIQGSLHAYLAAHRKELAVYKPSIHLLASGMQAALTTGFPQPPGLSAFPKGKILLRSLLYSSMAGELGPDRVVPFARDLREAERLFGNASCQQLKIVEDLLHKNEPGEMQLLGLIAGRIYSLSSHPVFSSPGFRAWVFNEVVAAVVKQVDATEKLLEEEKIGCVVDVTNHDLFGATMASVATAHGIPYVAVQQGFPAEFGYLPVLGSIQAVWGEESRSWFIGHGVPAKRLPITGNPRFDASLGSHRNSDAAKKVLGLKPETRLLVLATSPVGQEYNKALLSLVVSGIKNFKDICLAVHLHPGEYGRYDPQQVYGPLLSMVPQSRLLPNGTVKFQELLHASDLVLTSTWTVGLEAMICDKPVLVPEILGRTDLVPFTRAQGAVTITTPEQVARHVGLIMGDKAYVNLLKEYRDAYLRMAYPARGDACKRLAGLVQSLLDTPVEKDGLLKEGLI